MSTDIAVFGLGILVSVVLTRSLGPDLRGIYILLVSTNFLVSSAAHLSVGFACSTFLARGRLGLGEVNTVAVVLAIALGLLSVAIVVLAYQVPLLQDSVFKNFPFDYLLIAALLIPVAIYQVYWNSMMVGLNRIVTLNKLNLAVSVGNALLMLLVVGVLFPNNILAALVVWASSAFVGAVCAFVIAARIEPFVWPPRRSTMKDMLSFGLRGHGANIAQQLFLRFDMYAVNVFVGTAGVGFYSIATSLAERLWLPINAINSSSISKIAQLPREESALLTAKVVRTVLLIMLSVAVPFAIISPWLVPFLYGPEFAASVLPLVILALGTLGFAVLIVLDSYILGQLERPGLLSIISWLELAVSIPLYITLILWQGIVGAAIASTLTYLLAMGFALYIFVRYSGLSVAQVLLPRAQDFRDYAQVLRRGLRRVRIVRET